MSVGRVAHNKKARHQVVHCIMKQILLITFLLCMASADGASAAAATEIKLLRGTEKAEITVELPGCQDCWLTGRLVPMICNLKVGERPRCTKCCKEGYICDWSGCGGEEAEDRGPNGCGQNECPAGTPKCVKDEPYTTTIIESNA